MKHILKKFVTCDLKLVTIVFFVFLLVGCSRVRTYTVEEERVDQDLSAGNQGFLAGTPKETEALKNRKLTRKTYVTEVELGSAPKKIRKKRVVSSSRQAVTMESVQEPAGESVIEEAAPGETKPAGASAAVTSYVVQPNDTLQNIAIKVYGSSSRWKKIYEANSDQLKSPDRIYGGQVLKIPQE